MKIVHLVLGKANPERMNGVNTVVHQLASAMHEKGMDVEVWGVTATPEEKTAKRIYPLHLFAGSGRSFAVEPRLVEAIEALPQDTCVHFHRALIPAFYAIARLLKKRHISWVVTPHGAYDPWSMKRNYWVKWAFHFACDSWLFRHADTVQALTGSESVSLKKWCGQTPIAVLSNGYAPVAMKRTEAQYDLYRKNRPVFGFVGRMSKMHKGLDLLLEGFDLYKKAGGSGALWLVGDGPDRGALEKMTHDQGLDATVRFWGARFAEEKRTLLASMDVFVHTSRWEGMPMAVLEAAMHGLPLLLSSRTGLAETVTQYEGGFITGQNTPQEIAGLLHQCDELLREGRLSLIGQNARTMMTQAFDWGKIVERMAQKLYTGERTKHRAAI